MFVDITIHRLRKHAARTCENYGENDVHEIANNMAVGKGGGEERSLLSRTRERRGAAAAETVSRWRHRRRSRTAALSSPTRRGKKAGREQPSRFLLFYTAALRGAFVSYEYFILELY